MSDHRPLTGPSHALRETSGMASPLGPVRLTTRTDPPPLQRRGQRSQPVNRPPARGRPGFARCQAGGASAVARPERPQGESHCCDARSDQGTRYPPLTLDDVPDERLRPEDRLNQSPSANEDRPGASRNCDHAQDAMHWRLPPDQGSDSAVIDSDHARSANKGAPWGRHGQEQHGFSLLEVAGVCNPPRQDTQRTVGEANSCCRSRADFCGPRRCRGRTGVAYGSFGAIDGGPRGRWLAVHGPENFWGLL